MNKFDKFLNYVKETTKAGDGLITVGERLVDLIEKIFDLFN